MHSLWDSSPQQADGALTSVDAAFEQAINLISHRTRTLHLLSNTIRSASIESQSLDAARAFPICDEDGNNVEDFLRDHFTGYIRVRFPTVSRELEQRLAGAMVLRRKLILYRRSRYGTCPVEVQDVPSQPVVSIPRAQPTAQPAARLHHIDAHPGAGGSPESGARSSHWRRARRPLRPTTFTRRWRFPRR